MDQDNKHRSLLQFIRKIIDAPVGYSKDDLVMFRSEASSEYPSLVPLIDAYLQLAERADTDVVNGGSTGKARGGAKRGPEHTHLFDMLRETRFFPSNSDLSQFAAKVLPNMSRKRFDKMSRSDIAARIIEYPENRDPRTRQALEASMRDALVSGADKTSDD